VRSDLTVTYGLRYLLHTVPYEINGFQSVPSVNENVYFAARLMPPHRSKRSQCGAYREL